MKQPDLRSLQIKEPVRSNVLVIFYYNTLRLLYRNGQGRNEYQLNTYSVQAL